MSLVHDCNQGVSSGDHMEEYYVIVCVYEKAIHHYHSTQVFQMINVKQWVIREHTKLFIVLHYVDQKIMFGIGGGQIPVSYPCVISSIEAPIT